jgi:hypothetical protein
MTRMKILSSRPLIVLALFVIAATSAVAQSAAFTLENGKAVCQRDFSLQGRSGVDVYRDVERWLVKYYQNPEEIIKARIDGEYIKAVGYRPGIIKYGAGTNSDLQYTLTVSIIENNLQVIVTDVIVIYDWTQDAYGIYRLEDYFKPSKKPRKDPEGERVLAEAGNFTSALFESFQNSIFPPENKTLETKPLN